MLEGRRVFSDVCVRTHVFVCMSARATISEVMVLLRHSGRRAFSDHPLLTATLLPPCHYGDTGCYTSANRCRVGAVKKLVSIKILCVVSCMLRRLTCVSLSLSLRLCYLLSIDGQAWQNSTLCIAVKRFSPPQKRKKCSMPRSS